MVCAGTEDGFFSFYMHNLTQFDYRAFNPTGDPLNDSFVVPRERLYFLGNISKYANYYTVINDSYGSFNILDAFLDLNFGAVDTEKLQLRVGRMKTPYTYEWIRIPANSLIAPSGPSSWPTLARTARKA